MTNEEIGEKLSWLRRASNKLCAHQVESTNSPGFLERHTAVDAYNELRQALRARLSNQDAFYRSDWRDAIEIQLRFAVDQANAAAEAFKITLD